MKKILKGVSALLAVFVSGCVSLLPETAPPKPRYQIDAIDAGAAAGPAVEWSLVVEDPRTTRAFDTVKVAVAPAAGKIEYFSGAEWADRAPRLFQTALIQSFEDTGRILGVGDRAAVPIADIVLQTDIRELVVDAKSGGETPSLSIYARLTDGKGRVYAARRFDARGAASGGDADAIMAAFGAAFDTVITDIVTWSLDEGAGVIAARS
ncbi:MAG: ABC-type transport auxiliary lipoprotein family protein [Pseudomonadota bacterium]